MNQEDEKLLLFAERCMNNLEMELINYLDTYYGKPYKLDKRLKNIEKLKLKQRLLSNKRGYLVPLKELPDIIGFRISVENEEDVEVISKILNLLSPYEMIDYFNKPKDSGFKAYLYFFDNGVNAEIQIMTERMKEWTNATHDEFNIQKYHKL